MELYHHGIKGMKWGVRRFQNEDGTLTEKGRKRYISGGDDNEKLTKAGMNALVKQTKKGTKYILKNEQHRKTVENLRKVLNKNYEKYSDAEREKRDNAAIEKAIKSIYGKDRGAVVKYKNAGKQYIEDASKHSVMNALDEISGFAPNDKRLDRQARVASTLDNGVRSAKNFGKSVKNAAVETGHLFKGQNTLADIGKSYGNVGKTIGRGFNDTTYRLRRKYSNGKYYK